MKKFVLVPDSFKGTMSSTEICAVMADAIYKFLPEAQVASIPVADGGEGTVDAFLSVLGGERVSLEVNGPYGDLVKGFYGRIGEIAIVEMAAAAGLPLADGRRQVEKASTYGVGQLVAHALENGAKKLVIGLGGSATNDGGCGAAAALGIRFQRADGEAFIPVGETLSQIFAIDADAVHPGIKNAEITTMCDIDNPLCGKTGAAAVFAPQKGADAAMVAQLDAGLAHLAELIERDLGLAVREIPGAGAAGGMGAGMVAFFGSKLKMGIEAILDMVSFDELILGADAVFTGEGKIDGQSLRGKVVLGVARRAKQYGVPVIAVVGDIGENVEAVYEQGVAGVFSINRIAAPFSELRLRAPEDLRLTVENIIRFTISLSNSKSTM